MFETLTERLSKSFAFFRGQKEITEENVEEGLRLVRTALLDADVNFKIVQDFTDKVRQRVVGQKQLRGVAPGDQFIHAVNVELVVMMGPRDARLEFAKNGPTTVLMAGLQGAGKTTTCAKLAKHMRERHQRRPLLVAADIKRPAAVEQLRVLGRQTQIPVFHQEGLSPSELCRAGVEYARTAGADFVVLDTAGRLHVDQELMNELADISRAVRPTNTVLVVDAMTGQDAVNSAKIFHDRLELTGVILTKLDGDARGGAAVSLRAVTGRPILFVGVGEKIDDLDVFHADRMAGRILGMGDVVGLVEKAQTSISETEAQASFEKMVLGSFTLEDMLAQLRMIRKLGPMKKVLGMMPGMSGMADTINIDDKQMNRLEALFTSMTPRERLQPDILDMARRRRIARGAGQDVAAINDLLKRFKEMKLMMKQLNKLGLASQMGSKAKQESLRSMAPSGELAADPEGSGLFGGLASGLGSLGRGLGGMVGGLGGMAGGLKGGLGMGGGGGSPPDLAQMLGGPRPRGSSATRQSGSKRKEKRKKNKKGKRR